MVASNHRLLYLNPLSLPFPPPPPPPPLPACLPAPQVKVWDLRMLRPLHAYYSPAPAEWCDISQRGLLAVGYGRRVQVWKDALGAKAEAPYMTHRLAGGTLRDFHFCPYEVGAAGRLCCCLSGTSHVVGPAGSKTWRSWE